MSDAATFTGSRRAAIALNVTLMVLLACVAAAIVIYLTGFTTLRRRIDLTEARSYTLSAETRSLLASLDKSAEIVTIVDPVTFHWDVDRVRPKAMEYALDLLQEYKVRSHGKLSVDNLDVRLDDARVRSLLLDLGGLVETNLVVVKCGENRRVLTLDADLADFFMGSPLPVLQPTRMLAFKAEEAITSALYAVTLDKRPKVYVITGHDEMSVDQLTDREAGLLRATLEKDNLQIEPLALFAMREVPQDADAVLLLGPHTALVEEERAALDAYLRRGGKLLACVEPDGDASLDPLWKAIGIELERRFVIFPRPTLAQSAPATAHSITSASGGKYGSYGTHPITSALVDSNANMWISESGGISAAPGTDAQFTSLALSHPESFGDELVNGRLGDERQDPKYEKLGQRTLIAAVEPKAPYAGARVVFAASRWWLSNAALRTTPGNEKFARRAMAWLVGQKREIAVPPRRPRATVADLHPEEYDRILLYTVAYLPLGALVLAVVVWLARRRAA